MWYLRVALLAFFMMTIFSCIPAHAQQNVVFIILDACRDDCLDTSRGGVPLTPFLSTFPATRFRETSSTASWTRPSMASIFTSTHVDTHQIQEQSRTLPESFETMAEYLKSAGYATLAVQTNGVVSADWGFAQGFDQYIFNSFAPADVVTTTALSLVSNASTPFFLYLHFNQPHVPYYPPPPYRTMMGYPAPGLTAYEMSIVQNMGPYQRDYLIYHLGLQPVLTYEQLSPLGCDAARALYDGEVRFSDDQLEILISSIRASYPKLLLLCQLIMGNIFGSTMPLAIRPRHTRN